MPFQFDHYEIPFVGCAELGTISFDKDFQVFTLGYRVGGSNIYIYIY